MAKRILILATDGVEQVEMLLPHDYFIRNGYDVDIYYGSESEYITTSFGIKIKVEKRVKDVIHSLDDYTALFLPGGPGHKKLDTLPEMDYILRHFYGRDKVIGAICAAPVILAKRGYLKGKKAICFNAKELREVLKENEVFVPEPLCMAGNCMVAENCCEVVIDGNIITGLEMQSSLIFAKKFVELLNKKHK